MCETRLAVTSFFMHSGSRRKRRGSYSPHPSEEDPPDTWYHVILCTSTSRSAVPFSLIISVPRDRGDTRCADFSSWSRVTDGDVCDKTLVMTLVTIHTANITRDQAHGRTKYFDQKSNPANHKIWNAGNYVINFLSAAWSRGAIMDIPRRGRGWVEGTVALRIRMNCKAFRWLHNRKMNMCKYVWDVGNKPRNCTLMLYATTLYLCIPWKNFNAILRAIIKVIIAVSIVPLEYNPFEFD